MGRIDRPSPAAPCCTLDCVALHSAVFLCCSVSPCQCCCSYCQQRKQLLQTELRAINARIAELEEVQRSADASITPLQQQVDALQKRKLELQADTHSKAQG